MDNQTELLKGIEKRIEANTVAIDVNKKAISELQSTINHQQKGNLRVTGLPEKDDENMRETIIGILTKVIPVSVARLRETVDTVHRLGQRASAATSNNLPRAVIIQFGMRTVRDEVWKKSKEDFSKEDRLARTKLWPLVQEARSRGTKLSGSAGSSRCSPGSAAGAPATVWATWTTGLRFGSSQRSTGGMGFTLVPWGPSSSHGTSRGPSADFKTAT
ncbi:hypothetical protein SRHO_G00011210 [Serrasalmus rhombeus]